MGFTHTCIRFLTEVFALAADALSEYPGNAPHTGLYIPFKAARTVKIVTGLGSTVCQFQIKGVSDADGTL